MRRLDLRVSYSCSAAPALVAVPMCCLWKESDSRYQTRESPKQAARWGEVRARDRGKEGERKRESTWGTFYGAGQDMKVMSLSIRSAGPLAWVGCVSQRMVS